MFNKKIIFLALAIFLLTQPLFASAEIKFETTYPNLPGVRNLISATGSKNLGIAVQYYIQWILILAILVCVISLVWAGVQYISSTGQPGAMKDARSRIFNAFVGLAILTASYLILKTLNPQMSLLAIQKPSIPTGGIVLLTKNGYEQFKGDNFGDLMEAGEIKPISGDIADLSTEFGALQEINYGTDVSPIMEVNFPKFRLYAIGFWGETSKEYKVALFSNKKFSPSFQDASPPGPGIEPQIFTYEGRIMQNTEDTQTSTDDTSYFGPQDKGGADNKMRIFVINGHQQQSVVPNYRTQAMWGVPPGLLNSADYPPLSIQVKNLSNGNYAVNGDGTETFISAGGGIPDLKKAGIDMTYLRTQNKRKLPDGTIQISDYLSILSDDTDYEGNQAIYFQNRSLEQLKNTVPKLYFSSEFFKGQDELNFTSLTDDGIVTTGEQRKTDSEEKTYISEFQYKFFSEAELNSTMFVGNNSLYGRPKVGEGNKLLGRTNDFNYQYDGIYGNVKDPEPGKPSPVNSVTAGLEISPDTSVCKFVGVCKRDGHCIKFVPAGTTITPPLNDYHFHYLPMPFFRPVNLPKSITSWHFNKEGVAETFEDNFNDQVVEVRISGKCLVVLFDRRIIFGQPDNTTFKEFEVAAGIYNDSPFTGDNSVFIKNTTNSTVSIDLRSTKAMTCTALVKGVMIVAGHAPCTSAIAVFPIK